MEESMTSPSPSQVSNDTMSDNITSVMNFTYTQNPTIATTTATQQNVSIHVDPYQQYRLFFYLGIHLCVFLAVVCMALAMIILVRYIQNMRRANTQRTSRGFSQESERSGETSEPRSRSSKMVAILFDSESDGRKYLEKYGQYSRLTEDSI